MSREIKFRGKCADDGKWIFGYYIVQPISSGDTAPYIYDGEYEYRVIPETVSQMTGLQDKNGTDVYEGDLVSGGKLLCQDGFAIENDKNVVKFADGMFKAGSLSLVSISKSCEVIGNIWEAKHEE